MSILERTYRKAGSTHVDEVLISADSHVIEPQGLWQRELPAKYRDVAPSFGGPRASDHPGAMDKHERLREMAADGVSAEVLFPTHGLRVLSLDDPELEEACARVYNDWLIDYCSAAPDRLVGLALLSMYNVDNAIREMERCRDAGLRGVTIWQVPHPSLPFTSAHYDRFWAAAQEMQMPVNLHILSGHGYSKDPSWTSGPLRERNSVNYKLLQSMDNLFDIIFSGVLERFPRLKMVLAESEIGWLPFVLEQWDYYYRRVNSEQNETPIPRPPSEYFHRQVHATFFNDSVGAHVLSWWGADNCMWSNDYPHGNSTWGHSRDVLSHDLADLPGETRAKVLRDNVAALYDMPIPTPLSVQRA